MIYYYSGSKVLHKAMTERISTKPQHYMRTVAVKESENGDTLKRSRSTPHTTPALLLVRAEKKYSHVISTMSFECLCMVDLDHLYLSYGQRNAIRQLTCTPSIKMGLQFKTAWWKELGIVGGQSSTDRSISDMVYPSDGPHESHPNTTKSNCMIAAYNGMKDSRRVSRRLGGLMKGKDTPEERVMRDLATVHKVDVEML